MGKAIKKGRALRSKQFNQILYTKDFHVGDISSGKSFNMIQNERRSIIVDGECDISWQASSKVFDNHRININIKSVSKNFFCLGNLLKSFDNMPQHVGGLFAVGNNMFESLEGCPSNINGLNAKRNKLTTLKGCPHTHSISVQHNQLTSLEYLPEGHYDTLDFSHNNITTLVDIHKRIKSIIQLCIINNPIQEGGIGLLAIPGLKYEELIIQEMDIKGTILMTWFPHKPKPEVSSEQQDTLNALTIIKNYLKYDNPKKYMLQCTDELVEAGYERFAIL